MAMLNKSGLLLLVMLASMVFTESQPEMTTMTPAPSPAIPEIEVSLPPLPLPPSAEDGVLTPPVITIPRPPPQPMTAPIKILQAPSPLPPPPTQSPSSFYIPPGHGDHN
ncbi:hypothetical protein BVRB_9g212410 [Beta vulgaris subsp. vulgaris]|nr:hypothetical protein BVRB_9g212410 [Beta vulgaris subsp. vulgaris]